MYFIQFSVFLSIITKILTQSEVNFICKSGHLLRGIEHACDGIAQCYDGSDELIDFCAHTLCPAEYFRCNYGACVPRTKKCNGIRDCVDSSDETNCGRKQKSCHQTEFYCGDNGDDTDSYDYCIESSKICDGDVDCWNGADENVTICENALCPEHSFRCRYGGCVSETVLCDGFFDCLDGSDESQELCIALNCPKCTDFLVSCPPFVEQNIESNRLFKKCMWNGREMPCGMAQSILPGTKVTYACKDRFKPKSTKDTSNDWNLCQADGTWLRDILKCKPDCGRLSAGMPLITNDETFLQTMPWHASIYVVENVPKPKYICGATLISEAVLLTVAHCVWKLKADDLRIGMGNLQSEYGHHDDLFTRYFEVREIFVHEIYLDQFANYGSDIALLELSKPVEIDEVIAPVCMDFNFDDNVKDEELGMVVALSTTSNSSRTLHIKRIPIISHEKCVERETSEFRKYLSFTKFCAGWANGSAVCNGDSGAGLTTQKSNGRHYLQGIVSISPRKPSTDYCDPNQYTIFTKVGIYVKWIENHLKHINERYNPQLSTYDVSNDDNASP